MKKLCAALMLAVLPTLIAPAHAENQWFVLRHGSRDCVDASIGPAGTRTPHEVETLFRQVGTFSHTVVKRDGDPLVVYAVDVYRNAPPYGKKKRMAFFSHEGDCEVQLIMEFGGVTKEDLN